MFERPKLSPDEQEFEDVKRRYQEALRAIAATTVSQEVFSRPGDAAKPAKEQEFVELRIDDEMDSWKPGFVVTEVRFRWSEIDGDFTGDEELQEQWPSLQTAQNRYEARRRALVDRGFTHSDMEF